MKSILAESDLVLNQANRIYHLDLGSDDIAQTIFLVGDPDRVGLVSQFFDKIELKRQHREFITHTGYVGKQRLSVVSTGISTANIDIVLNELDALVNIDFTTRQLRPKLKQLNLIRIGTAGSLQADIALDSFVATNRVIGLGSLLNFYAKPFTQDERALQQAFEQALNLQHYQIPTTVSTASSMLLDKFAADCHVGMTVTCPGFYAPQGRFLRADPVMPNIISDLSQFQFDGYRIANLEMETSAIYGIGQVFNHHCLSLSAIVANRITKKFSAQPQKAVLGLIELAVKNVSEMHARFDIQNKPVQSARSHHLALGLAE